MDMGPGQAGRGGGRKDWKEWGLSIRGSCLGKPRTVGCYMPYVDRAPPKGARPAGLMGLTSSLFSALPWVHLGGCGGAFSNLHEDALQAIRVLQDYSSVMQNKKGLFSRKGGRRRKKARTQILRPTHKIVFDGLAHR